MLSPETAKEVWRWIIQGLIGFFLLQAMNFMRNTEEGLRDLSVKLAVIVEKVTQQDRMLEFHEKRLQTLEEKKHGNQGK